jgi:hypothetical protein
MKDVARALAEIRLEVESIENSRQNLQSDRKQRLALLDIKTSGRAAARKAESVIVQLLGIREKLKQYQRETEG